MGICNFKVNDLIDWQRFRWRRPLIRQLFPKELHQKIFAIHIPRRQVVDECYWTFARDGKFSVKSAYFVAGKRMLCSFKEDGKGLFGRKFGV